MKKFLLIFASVLLITLTACSQFLPESDCSLVFTIDESFADGLTKAAKLKSSCRAAEETDLTDSLFFEVSISGNYSAKETIAVKEGNVLTFSELTENMSLVAEGLAYYTETLEDGSENRVELYKGKSETIILKAGLNELSLTLNKVEVKTEEESTKTEEES
nr:hypothetical protein [Treponema sp.]